MKFCPNCGTHMEDHFTFCPSCGTPQPAAPAKQPSPFAPREYTPMPEGGHYYVATDGGGNKKKLIAIIAIVVVAVALVAVLFTTLFSSPKSTVKAFIKAFNDRNAEKIVSLEYPKPVLEYWEDRGEDKDDLIDNVEDAFESGDEIYGNDWKVKDIKIKKVKDLKEDAFENLQEKYDDLYDMKITDAKKVKAEFTVEGEKKDEECHVEGVVYKYKGKWYIEYYVFS